MLFIFTALNMNRLASNLTAAVQPVAAVRARVRALAPQRARP
jgi:hypothetical protein